MKDNQQFEQLMLQYQQLKNGAEDIYEMINEEDYDGAISMVKAREAVFLNCKCMRKYLELTPEQEKQVNEIVEEIRKLEMRNMDMLSMNLDQVQSELKKTQKTEKINNAYTSDESQKGTIINLKE